MNAKLPVKKTLAAKAPMAAKKMIVKKVVAKKVVATLSKAAPAAVVVPAPALVKAKLDKALKPVKAKLVRDSFTIPKDEYQVLADLKARMTQLMQPVKKSELLRAGLKALAAMQDAAIKKALQAVPSIKTGRPAKIIKK
jgi:hypothetical protein